MRRLRTLIIDAWRPLLLGGVFLAATSTLLLIRLNSLPNRLSSVELTTRVTSQSWHTIWHNPLNAPITVSEHIVVSAHPLSIFAARLVPALFGLLSIVLFFAIVRFWFGTLTSLLATALFACSSWFLLGTRFDTPEVLWNAVLAIVACGLWLKHSMKRNLIIPFSALIIALILYIPGMIWFVLAGLGWRYKSLVRELRHTHVWVRIFSVFIMLAVLAPLIWALTHQPALIWDFLGLPRNLPTLSQLGHNLANIPLNLFFYAHRDPLHTLGHLPALNIFVDAMFLLGLYGFWENRKLDRTRLLVGIAALGVVLVTVGVVSLAILLPIVFIVVAAGLTYMLDAWLNVFPHNPIARSVGVIVLIVAVGFSCNVELHRFFVAWPKAPTTQSTFTNNI